MALVDRYGNVVERYEYDAYGNCHVLEPNFADDPDGQSDYENPYFFQGKRLDLLDDGGLELMAVQALVNLFRPMAASGETRDDTE